MMLLDAAALFGKGGWRVRVVERGEGEKEGDEEEGSVHLMGAVDGHGVGLCLREFLGGVESVEWMVEGGRWKREGRRNGG